ncbi:MAG: hypothetical protein ABR588_01075 [Sphingomicrobium sp.]|nr:hypothetical protein [Sphingomonadales bacterium]
MPPVVLLRSQPSPRKYILPATSSATPSFATLPFAFAPIEIIPHLVPVPAHCRGGVPNA